MAVFLPTAEIKTFGQKNGSRPRRADAPPRIVLHTTETDRLPGYNNGKAAPHFTVGVGHPGSLRHEKPGVVRVWQHVPVDRTARALKHSRPPETNHMGSSCIQIEMVTYVGDQPAAGIVGNKGNLPTALITAVAGLVREILEVVDGVNIDEFPSLWSSENAASSTARQRMTTKQWERFNGICGHQHVPGNSHWDPGALDIKAFVKLLANDSAGSGATRPDDNTVDPGLATWPLLFEEGDVDDHVKVIRGLLQVFGFGQFEPSDAYTDEVAEAVLAFQNDEAIRVDGIWGPETHGTAQVCLATLLRR